MRWGVKRTLRRGAAISALLGVAFYTLLLPWHLTSQLNLQLFAAAFGADAALICSTSGAAADPATPGAPATSCPICKGLAAFHLAVAPPLQWLAPVPVGPSPYVAHLRTHVAGAHVPTPRNRGPPLPA